MMKVVNGFTLAAAVFTATAVAGTSNTLHVRLDGSGGAYTSIQAAVDAASPGDTIRIAAGVYEEGYTEDGFSVPLRNRVYIDKSLTLIGEDRNTTVIKGARASVAEDAYGLGLGSDAVRCLGIKANDVRIENLTLTGGATHVPEKSDNPDGNGGGVYAANGYNNIVIVDCIISNNIAYRGGGARYANDATHNMLFARCHFDFNRTANSDPLVRGCKLVHCLLTGHFTGGSLVYAAELINCTVADGNCRATGDEHFRAYNCIFADKWYKLDSAAVHTNCVICSVDLYDAKVDPAQTNACVVGADGKGVGFDHFVAPPLCDYRLHSGATDVLNAGSAAHLSRIPEEFRYTDFYGNTFEPAGAVIAAGCSQESVTPVGGKIVFGPSSFAAAGSQNGGAGYKYGVGYTNDFLFGESGHLLVQMKQLGYIRAATWPTVVKFRINTMDWADLYGFEASGADTMWRFPYLDNTYSVVAPRSTSATLTLIPKAADSVVYVDQDSTAENPDGSQEAPFTDLQQAIDSVAKDGYAVIRSFGGVFSSGGTFASSLTNRISVAGRKCRIVGEAGPSANVITGAAGPSETFGLGTDAVRCVFLDDGSVLQGFTLTGGSTDLSKSTIGKRGGGAFLGLGAQLTDCVISNCTGVLGAAVAVEEKDKKSNAYMLRCSVTENRCITDAGALSGSGGIVRGAVAISSLFDRNEGSLTGNYEEQPFYFSTISDFCADLNCLGSTSLLYNVVVYMPSNKINNATAFGGVFNFRNGALNGRSTGFSRDDAMFADPENGDFRLATVSPAKNAVALDSSDFLHAAITRDVFGHGFVFADGLPLCGAVHSFAPTMIVTSGNDGDGLSGSRTNVFSTAGEVVFTAEKAAVRPYLGMEVTVGGVTVTNSSVSYTHSVAAAADAPETIEISVNALYDTNWYVNKDTGDDAGYGTASAPKLTLAAALTNAVFGDTVHVAAGEYATGKMYQTRQLGNQSGSYSLASRAVVPDGVELRGAGADVTFIVGESDPAVTDETLKGCGPNAVRCVALGTGAKLTGFTLTGGRTDANGSADDFHGGGVLSSCLQPLAEVTDCVISNCVARRGGGAMFGAVNRCAFFDDSVIMGGNGPAFRGNGVGTASMRNCIVDTCSGWATVYMVTEVSSCTFGAGVTDANGNTGGITLLQDCFAVTNSLILGDRTIAIADSSRFCTLKGCALTQDTLDRFANKENITAESCVIAEPEYLAALDEDYSPLIGVNPAVDAAVSQAYDISAFGDRDVHGNPRFANGARLDIGAVEASWLAEYSQALGNAVAVTQASPEVLLDESVSGVRIPSGATFSAFYGREGYAASRVEITASVADGGALDVVSDPHEWRLASGEGQIVAFKTVSDVTGFLFSATGADSVLHGLDRRTPFTFIVR